MCKKRRACFENRFHPPRHVIYSHYGHSFAMNIDKEYSSHIKYVSIVCCSHLTYSTMCTKGLKENLSDRSIGRRGFWIKQDFILLLSLCIYFILWQGPQAALVYYCVCWYLLFQISISSNMFRIQWILCRNWLFCSDLSCKWPTCLGECERFWTQALQIPSYKEISIYSLW